MIIFLPFIHRVILAGGEKVNPRQYKSATDKFEMITRCIRPVTYIHTVEWRIENPDVDRRTPKARRHLSSKWVVLMHPAMTKNLENGLLKSEWTCGSASLEAWEGEKAVCNGRIQETRRPL